MLESLGQRSSFTRIKNARGFDLGLLFCKTVWGSIPLKAIFIILQKGGGSSMQRTRKPIPVSLRRLITERNRTNLGKSKSKVLDFSFSACTKAVRVHNRWTGECLGNAYFTGDDFYFSRQMMKSIGRVGHEDYFKVHETISMFLNDCLFVGGFR